MSKGKIIGVDGATVAEKTPDEPKISDMQLSPINHYWVVWFNPETEKIERAEFDAHIVDVHDSGLLVFRAFVKNRNTEAVDAGMEAPFNGYYVTSFAQHVRFGQMMPLSAVN